MKLITHHHITIVSNSKTGMITSSVSYLCFLLSLTFLVIIRFVIPIVFNKLIRVQCMSLSTTTLFYFMVEAYLHYYLRYNYIFWLLTRAIFRLYMNP